MVDDAGAAIQSMSTEDFLGPGHAVSALQSDATRRQLVDLPLPVLLATFDTNAAADLRANLAPSTCRPSSSRATPTRTTRSS